MTVRYDAGRHSPRHSGASIPGFLTRQLSLSIGGIAYRLRVLRDLQQFSDPDGHGARLGISSAQWSLFGQLWVSGQLLAQAMHRFDIEGKRFLELGCGIGLASLVLQRRGARVVASDVHPLAESFLAYNSALNGLPAVHFRHLRWDSPLLTLGLFDVIIASDVMYERGQAEILGEVIERHMRQDGEVLVTDPGRGNSGKLTRLLQVQGFSLNDVACPLDDEDPPPYRGKVLHYRRGCRA